jgi:hypothetical protein
MSLKRAFLLGRCTSKSKTVWLLKRMSAPIAGPFTLCGMVKATLPPLRK